jgi:osmotically-inducible protein OsmY
MTMAALSATPREETNHVDLDRKRVLLLRAGFPRRDLSCNQGVRDEVVAFPHLMNARHSAFSPDRFHALEVSTMQRSGQVPDKRISQKVEQHISRAGLGSHTKVKVTIRNGDVTLSGTLQYETQRRPVLHAVRSVEGVRRVVDQLQVKAAPKKW